MICLADLLTVSQLSELNVIAGHGGLSKEISTVTLLDAPDGPKWLKGGEFVLTSAYIFENDYIFLKKYILALIEQKASGLGIKTGRFLDQIPEEIMKLADTEQFPLVQIPYKLVWTDIIAPFYRLKYDLYDQIKPIVVEPNMVLPLFDASRWGSRHLLGQLSGLFHLPAAIYRQDKSLLLDNGIQGVSQIKLVMSQLKALPERRQPKQVSGTGFTCSVFYLPLSYDGQREYLAIASERGGDLEEINKLMELLESLSGNDAATLRDKSNIYRTFLYKIVVGEITPDEITLFEENRLEGHRGKIYTCILVFSAPHYQKIFEYLEEALDLYWKHKEMKIDTYLFDNSARQQAVVLMEMYSSSEIDGGPWIRGLIRTLNPLIPRSEMAYISFSSMTETLKNIAEIYEQAQQALKLGKLLWPDQTCFFYPDYSMYTIFNKSSLEQVNFADVKLVLENKSTAAFDALETAEAYTESGSYKKAAARLFVHENTLRYRINKVSELLNINLENSMEGHRFLSTIKLWRLYCGMGEDKDIL